jgi:hypothetical protein
MIPTCQTAAAANDPRGVCADHLTEKTSLTSRPAWLALLPELRWNLVLIALAAAIQGIPGFGAVQVETGGVVYD